MPNQVCDSFIERQQDTIFATGGVKNQKIARTRQVFINNRVRFVSGQTQICGEIDRQIFIKLEFHRASKGINRSSCASSAA